jgi:hypothetical protein
MSNDPAFLFYDGDAARDVSHMNRLERGAYFDIIQAQRKFGPLSLPQIQKILGKDFDSCWPSIELIMQKEGESYSLVWLKESILRRKHHCEQQKQRVMKRWASYHGNTTVIPRVYLKENENENEIKRGVGRDKIQVPVTEREALFRQQVFAQTEHPEQMLMAFFNYWSEIDPSGKKMRFEKQPTWELKKRLATWRSRDQGANRKTHEFEQGAASKYDRHP